MSSAAAAVDSDAPSTVVAAKLKLAAEKKRAQRKAREENKKKAEVAIDESKNEVKKIPKRKKAEEPEPKGYTIEKIEEPVIKKLDRMVKEGKMAHVAPAAPTPPVPKLIVHTDLPSALDHIFKLRDPYYRFKIAGVAAAFAGAAGYAYAPTLAVALNGDLR